MPTVSDLPKGPATIAEGKRAEHNVGGQFTSNNRAGRGDHRSCRAYAPAGVEPLSRALHALLRCVNFVGELRRYTVGARQVFEGVLSCRRIRRAIEQNRAEQDENCLPPRTAHRVDQWCETKVNGPPLLGLSGTPRRFHLLKSLFALSTCALGISLTL